MALHLIIDGYNLIRQSGDLQPVDRQSIEFGRDALIERLAVYKKIKRHKITVVFDGSQRYYFPEPASSEKGIRIKFSRHGETADALIRKMAEKEREKAMVVSADREIIEFAASRGAAVIDPAGFEEKMIMAEMMEAEEVPSENEPETGWVPTTKKKGPGRRLPRSKRRNRNKIRKL